VGEARLRLTQQLAAALPQATREELDAVQGRLGSAPPAEVDAAIAALAQQRGPGVDTPPGPLARPGKTGPGRIRRRPKPSRLHR
jgi:hypothetical protein